MKIWGKNLFLDVWSTDKQDKVLATVLKLKNLTYIQQTNNKILTESPGYISHLYLHVNWLFIIWFWLVKKMPASIRHFL
jgi:hypothetical protein